jgi:hypothetical protein
MISNIAEAKYDIFTTAKYEQMWPTRQPKYCTDTTFSHKR